MQNALIKACDFFFTWIQVALNKSYLALLDVMLNTENFYFSSTYDLTHTLQRLYNTSPDFQSLALHERVSYNSQKPETKGTMAEHMGSRKAAF